MQTTVAQRNSNDVNYPRNWNLNIGSLKELAERLGYSQAYLKKLSLWSQDLYIPKTIPGRTLLIPRVDLRNVQREIYKKLLAFDFPPYIHGGISGRSILTNALQHREQKWVSCFDVRKFFPSTHFRKVTRLFLDLGCDPNSSELLTRLTTYNYELPQGAPTSPVVANILMFPSDVRILNLCKLRGYKYSRFFDDITISGKTGAHKLEPNIKRILADNNYTLKPGKTSYQPAHNEQLVCGVKVNERKLSLASSYLQEIEGTIARYGQGEFGVLYFDNPAKVVESLRGSVEFIRSIDKKFGESLLTNYQKIAWPHH